MKGYRSDFDLLAVVNNNKLADFAYWYKAVDVSVIAAFDIYERLPDPSASYRSRRLRDFMRRMTSQCVGGDQGQVLGADSFHHCDQCH